MIRLIDFQVSLHFYEQVGDSRSDPFLWDEADVA
jgi:hypothetical protein